MANIKLKNISDQSQQGDFVLSNLKQFEAHNDTLRPSVKLVFSGTENYIVNGRNFKLEAGSFLIVDKHSKIELGIDDKNGVEGVCIFPTSELINDVSRTQNYKSEELLDNPFDKKEVKFFEKSFKYGENKTGRFLQHYVKPIINGYDHNIDLDFDSFYIGLAECMVEDQFKLGKKLNNLSSSKRTTKEELYRRVSNAKDLIEACYTDSINLDDLAQTAFLSKYHFLRSFKQLYKVSPYQYILQLRLNKAQELLSLDYSYAEVSNIVGFSDDKNLRKAIKKLQIV